MGRKAKFDETHIPSGHGRKAKKQGDPVFPKGILGINIIIHFSYCLYAHKKLSIWSTNLFSYCLSYCRERSN
jgi:hypothetical protein